MKKYLVTYYSNTGNSEFLAKKLAAKLECDIKRIVPKIDKVLVLFLLSLFRISIPTNITVKEMEEYDEVLMLGPIWGGLLISPLRSILKKCVRASNKIHFILTCETSEEAKNDKYGYAKVLSDAKKVGGATVIATEVFSTSLIKGEEESKHSKLSDKVKITEDNFKGKIKEKFEQFVSKVLPA